MQLFGIAETGDTPSIVHQSSIDPPSKRWTIDGVSMENRWSIYGGIREKQRSFLQGISSVLGVKNQERERTKFPHRQGIYEKLMRVWENIMIGFIYLASSRTRIFNNNVVKLRQMWILLKLSFIIKDRFWNP